MGAHISVPVTGVSSRLNSATGTPLIASMGANPAAGYTTEEVPTCNTASVHYYQSLDKISLLAFSFLSIVNTQFPLTSRQRSQSLSALCALSMTWESRGSPNHTT